MSYDFKDLKSNIVKGRVTETITQLQGVAKDELKDNKIAQELTLLQYRWEKIQREERQNVVSYEQASITKNQITSALLQLIDKMESISKREPSSVSFSPARKILVAAIGLLAIGAIAYFGFFRSGTADQTSVEYIKCPFKDTLPYNILIIPFENYNEDIYTDKIDVAIREGLSLSAGRYALNTMIRIHEDQISIPDYAFAKQKLKDCKANLLIWGTYEESDSIDITLKYVADNIFNQLMGENEGIKSIFGAVKSVSSIERGEIISQFEDILSVTTPFLTGLNMIKEQKFDEALDEFSKINPVNSKVKSQVAKAKGDVFLLKGQYDDAIESYSDGHTPRELNADVLNNIGYALYQKGDLDGAYENFQKAANLNSENNDIAENLRILDQEFNKLRQGITDTGDDTAQEQEESIEEEVPIPEPAVVVPEDDLPTICSGFVDCHNQGRKLVDEGNYQEGLKYLNAAVEYDNTKPDPFLLMSKAHNDQGNYDKAILSCMKAQELDPDFPNTYYYLYVAYYNKQDMANANKYKGVFDSLGGKLLTLRNYNQ